MFTMLNQETRHALGTVAAVLVMTFVGLVFEFGHTSVLPEGRVEIGQLQPVGPGQLAMATTSADARG
jgi:hypothetical protein